VQVPATVTNPVNILKEQTATQGEYNTGGQKRRKYAGGAIYSFEPELRFLRSMARKSRRYANRYTKRNKRRSRRLRK